jgi:hypothetical protein
MQPACIIQGPISLRSGPGVLQLTWVLTVKLKGPL